MQIAIALLNFAAQWFFQMILKLTCIDRALSRLHELCGFRVVVRHKQSSVSTCIFCSAHDEALP